MINGMKKSPQREGLFSAINRLKQLSRVYKNGLYRTCLSGASLLHEVPAHSSKLRIRGTLGAAVQFLECFVNAGLLVIGSGLGHIQLLCGRRDRYPSFKERPNNRAAHIPDGQA